MRRCAPAWFSWLVAATLALGSPAAFALEAKGRVVGGATTLELLRAADAAPVERAATMAALQGRAVPVGAWLVRATVNAAPGAFVEVPECQGRSWVDVDGQRYAPPHGTFAVRLGAETRVHVVTFPVTVSGYDKRVTCSGDVRAGALTATLDGFRTLRFSSPERDGGEAILYVPRGHPVATAGPLLVGLHPWNGDRWTYAAAGELIAAADAEGVPLLFPSGLGNSLYAARAEREVLRAIDAACGAIAVDPARVSLWGASMGGAGATTIGFHHPDRFALVASFFGDSRYDLSTYVRAILPTPAAAHAVNALDVADNARHLRVRLFHGEADTVSPIAQSEMLERELKARGFDVSLSRASGEGHSGALVARAIARVVSEAKQARAPGYPERVTYASVRDEDTGAYGVRIVKKRPGDARVDLAREGGAVHVKAAVNVAAIRLDRAALGGRSAGTSIVDDARSGVSVAWE